MIRRAPLALAATMAVAALALAPLLLPRSAVAETATHVPAPAAAPASAGLAAELLRQAPTLDPGVLARALDAVRCAVAAGEAEREDTLTVIDYSLPSTAKRLWVFDLERRRLLFHELVAHGKNTGENHARRFSNVEGSLQTSLGLFRTDDTYYGKNGYSLRLHGLEPGINHLALPRTIVIHGAPYVSAEFARRHGRIGRSWGCPAVPDAVARPLIDTIKGGTLVFSYYPDRDWLGGSTFLAASCGVGGGTPPTVVAAR